MAAVTDIVTRAHSAAEVVVVLCSKTCRYSRDWKVQSNRKILVSTRISVGDFKLISVFRWLKLAD
jgi:hypothetical protein